MQCVREHMLLAESTVTIERDVRSVRAQFGDVAHHQRRGVHRGVRFEVLDDDELVCRYRQVTSAGPFRVRQELELARAASGPLHNRIVSGAMKGGSVAFSFADADGGTRVTARLEAPLGGASRLIAPIVRRRAARMLARALAEDKADLELGNYSPLP